MQDADCYNVFAQHCSHLSLLHSRFDGLIKLFSAQFFKYSSKIISYFLIGSNFNCLFFNQRNKNSSILVTKQFRWVRTLEHCGGSFRAKRIARSAILEHAIYIEYWTSCTVQLLKEQLKALGSPKHWKSIIDKRKQFFLSSECGQQFPFYREQIYCLLKLGLSRKTKIRSRSRSR